MKPAPMPCRLPSTKHGPSAQPKEPTMTEPNQPKFHKYIEIALEVAFVALILAMWVL